MTGLTRRAPTEDGIPVIIEDADRFPFLPGERGRDWREATDAEYAAYLAEWDTYWASFEQTS